MSRIYSLFELLFEDIPLLDIGYSDLGVLEIAFNPVSDLAPIRFLEFTQALEDGKYLAEQERASNTSIMPPRNAW